MTHKVEFASKNLVEYLGIHELQNICNYFSVFFKVSTAILDIETHSIIVASGDINVNFSKKKSYKIIDILNNNVDIFSETSILSFGEKYYIYENLNNIENIIIPIKFYKEEVALFYIEQHTFDETYFSKQFIVNFLNFLIRVIEKIELQNKLLENMKKKEEQEKITLLASEERFRLVLEGSQLGFWDWNIVTGEVVRNKQWANMLGYTFEEIQNTTKQWEDFLHPDDRSKAWESIDNHLKGLTPIHEMEYRMLTKNGDYKWIFDRAMITARNSEGKPLRMSGTHTDITERKNKEKELLYWANHDKLTGLYNRVFLESALTKAKDENSFPLGVIIADIDNLKQVNDTFGHAIGDELIRSSSKLLLNAVTDKNIVARTGGDEFTILIYDSNYVKLEEFANKIRDLEKNDTNFIPVKISVGIAIAENIVDLAEALKEADTEMYLNKKRRKNM